MMQISVSKKRWLTNHFLSVVVLLLMSMVVTGQTEFYVSHKGKDHNPGTKAKPFVTIKQAKEAIRKLKQEGSYPANGVTVILRGGLYEMHEQLDFTSEDSGTEESPVVYKAFPGEEVCIHGGVELRMKDLKPVQDPGIKKRLKPDVQNRIHEIDMSMYASFTSDPWPKRFRGYAGWPEVYIDEQPLQLSRWPNTGYTQIKKVIDQGSRPRHNEQPERAGSFKFKEDNPTSWDTSQPIYLGGYWCFKWYDEFIQVKTINRQKKEIHLAAPHQYGIGGPSKGLYYAINVLEELDQPGEYVFDKKHEKIYLLLPEEIGKKAKVEVAFSNHTLFSVNHSSNLQFEDITFSTHCGDIFNVEQSSKVVFKKCTFKNSSSSAVLINGGIDCGLDSCLIYNIGKTAVSLDGGDRNKLEASSHFVKSCHIHHFSRHIKTYSPAVLLGGVGQIVAHNYIHDAPHCAILFNGNDHQIENNHIERVCLDTSDAGAIYCGRDWTMGGTIIRQNLIAQLGEASHHHNWGIYLDDMASGIEVSENMIVDSPSGILVGGGRNNVIKDNLMLNCPQASIMFDARAMGWAANHIAKRSGTMWVNLDKVPYNKPPWSDRFPYLAKIEGDDPGQPKHNRVVGNRAINAAEYEINDLVSEYGEVTNNTLSKEDISVDYENGRVLIKTLMEKLGEAGVSKSY
jgi:parallel beta-helix repeat protein